MEHVTFYRYNEVLGVNPSTIRNIVNCRKLIELSTFALVVDLRVAAIDNLLADKRGLNESKLNLFLLNDGIPKPNRATAMAWASLCAPSFQYPNRDLCLLPAIPRFVDGVTPIGYNNIKQIRQLLPELADSLINRGWESTAARMFADKQDSSKDWGHLAMFSSPDQRADPNHPVAMRMYAGPYLEGLNRVIFPPITHHPHYADYDATQWLTRSYAPIDRYDQLSKFFREYRKCTENQYPLYDQVPVHENPLFNRWAILNQRGLHSPLTPEWSIDSVTMGFTMGSRMHEITEWVTAYYSSQTVHTLTAENLFRGEETFEEIWAKQLQYIKTSMVPRWRAKIESAFQDPEKAKVAKKTRPQLDEVLASLKDINL